SFRLRRRFCPCKPVSRGRSAPQFPSTFWQFLPASWRKITSNAMEDALSYIRVSSDEQADSGLGLEAQGQRIAAYCQMKGLRLAEVFEDSGISGGKPLACRPAGSQLLVAAKKRRSIVIVAKLDRLFRSVADASTVIADFDKKGIQLVALAEGFDTTNPYGRGDGANGQHVRRAGTGHDTGRHAQCHEREALPRRAHQRP